MFCKTCLNDVKPSHIQYDSIDSVLRGVTSTQQAWNYQSVRTIGMTIGYRF